MFVLILMCSYHHCSKTLSEYLSVLPCGDQADFQLDLSLMLLIDLKHDQSSFTSYVTKENDSTSTQTCTHIKDVQVVVYQILYDLHLVFSFPVSLEETGSEQQRQVLSAHLVQICTLLDSETEEGSHIITSATNNTTADTSAAVGPVSGAHFTDGICCLHADCK